MRSHELSIMRTFLLLGLAAMAHAHPLCYFDDRPTDFKEVLEFCPEQSEGACCNDMEEADVIATYEAAGPLSDECGDYYKQVRSL